MTKERLIQRAPFAAFAVLTLALAAVPVAAAESEPEPMPEPYYGDINLGMVPVLGSGMEYRPHSSYVVVDALEWEARIMATEYQTPFLDLVTINLVPGHVYRLDLVDSHTPFEYSCDSLDVVPLRSISGLCSIAANEAFKASMSEPTQDPAGPDGQAIFWNVPLWPATYHVMDVTTGEFVMVIKVQETQVPELSKSQRSTTWSQPKNSGPPQPKYIHTGPGETTVQGAYSFTPDATVQTTTCWGHNVRVEAYVSGGTAAASGTAGGSRSTSRSLCDTIESSGTGSRLRYQDTFQKDTYNDGSYKVYPKSWGQDVSYESHNPGWGSSGSYLYTSTSSPITRTVTENNAGGVRLSGTTGSETMGVGLTVILAADLSEESKIQIRVDPPDSSNHRYQWKFVNGDQTTTGIYGMVWKHY